MPEIQDTKKLSNLGRTIIAASCLFALDAVVFHQLGLGLFTALVLVVCLILVTLYDAVKGNREITVLRAQKLLVYSVTVVAIVATFRFNNWLAERRAEDIIRALDRFHEQQGRYPTSLEKLVPEYLDAIPRAHFTLHGGSFQYNRTILMYYQYSPWNKRCYDLEKRKWYTID